jgi:hypothetical protein
MLEASFAHALPNALLMMLFSCFTHALIVLYSFFTAARAYKPDFVLISAGFDAASGDPLGLYNIIAIYSIFFFYAAFGDPLGLYNIISV